MEIKVRVEQPKSIGVSLKDTTIVNPASGIKEITSNGVHDIKDYEFVDVFVSESTPQEKNVEYTANGSYEVLPDEDNVLTKVGVTVNVPIPEGYLKPSGTLDINSNGKHNIRDYEFVDIEVPIPEGYIKPSGTLNIETNGEHDITNYEKVNVNIESSGSNTSDATASANDILFGKTAYIASGKVVGTIETYDGSFVNAILDTLPSGYTQLTYIESTGEQYIDTEFNMTTTSELELTMEITEYNTKGKMGFLGSYETNSTLYQLYASGTGNEYFYGTFGGKNYIALSKFDLGTPYNIIMKANTITINTEVRNFTSDGLNNAIKPLYLFWRNSTGEKAKMKLYSCNIYDNNVAVRKFVPCLRDEDNTIGLYDLIGNHFYENKGTGEFIGG